MPVKQYFPRLPAADAKWNTQFVDSIEHSPAEGIAQFNGRN